MLRLRRPNKNIGNNILVLIIALNLLSFLDKKIFDIYESIFYYGNLLILIAVFVFLRTKITKEEIINIMFMLIILIYSTFTLFITKGGFGSVITLLYSYFLLLNLYKFKYDNKNIKRLLIVLILVNFYWAYNSTDYYIKSKFYREEYINSNTVGMLLMYTAIYIKIFLKKLNAKSYKFLVMFIYIISLWSIINVQSRGALISLIAFIVLDNLTPKKIWKYRKNTLFVFVTIIFLGTIFPFLYINMYLSGKDFLIPFVKKSLYTGRESIWVNFINLMGKKPISWLFGLGSRVNLWDYGSLNLHNNYLAIIANFGIIGYILYYYFIILQINNIYKYKHITNVSISSIIGFLCVLIIGYVEVSTLWHMMFFLNFMFLGLAYQNNE